MYGMEILIIYYSGHSYQFLYILNRSTIQYYKMLQRKFIQKEIRSYVGCKQQFLSRHVFLLNANTTKQFTLDSLAQNTISQHYKENMYILWIRFTSQFVICKVLLLYDQTRRAIKVKLKTHSQINNYNVMCNYVVCLLFN